MGQLVLVVVRAVGFLSRELEEANDVIKQVYNLDVKLVKLVSDEAEDYIERRRGQVNAYRYVKRLVEVVGEGELVIALTENDIFVPGYNFCFGLAYRPAAVVSLYRLRGGCSEEIYVARVRKEISHEVGHLLGLNHCRNPRCVMYFSNSISDTDAKEELPCERCRLSLGLPPKAPSSTL